MEQWLGINENCKALITHNQSYTCHVYAVTIYQSPKKKNVKSHIVSCGIIHFAL